jgi:sortase A
MVMEIPNRGEPVARLQIPTLGINQIVVMGVGTSELKAGPGHFPGTPLPGQLGNAAIAGHRTSYGAPFGDVDRLSPGDELKLTTVVGEFRYVVTGSEVVDPSAVYVVDTVDPSVASLTLVTCHPRYSISQRLIVYAELDESESAAPTPPTPSTTLAPTSTTPTSPGDSSQPPAPDPDTSGALDEVDPFAAGWFADDAAWWHVAGWGLLLSLIAIGATLMGRARSNQRFGAVVGIGPFLVVLYFFFQNANRLLPPGL